MVSLEGLGYRETYVFKTGPDRLLNWIPGILGRDI